MDEMPEVTQTFLADVNEYVAEVGRAKDAADKLAKSSEEVKLATDGMKDKLLEAAMALKITRDEEGKYHDKAGEVITATELQARALKHLRDKALEAAWAMRELDKYEEKGFFSKLFGSGGKLSLGSIGSGLQSLGSDALSSIGSTLTSALGTAAAIVAAIFVIGPEVAALATGLMAAGAGVAAVGLVAVSNYRTAATAANAVQQAQINYNAAIHNGVKHATAYRAEQIAISKAYAQLSPQQVTLSKQIGDMQNAWQSFIQANTGTASKILTQVFGIITQFMPTLQQFVTSASPAISQLLTGLGKFVGGPEFKTFMTFLSSLSGPAISAIGSGMSGIANQLITFFEAFSKKDVINSINIAFRLLGFTITVVTGLILYGMMAWDQLTTGLHNVANAFDHARHTVADFAHNVAAHFDEIRHTIATWAHDIANKFDEVRHWIAQKFDEVRHDIAHIWDNIVKFFESIPGRIVHALGDVKNLLVQAGKDIINGLWNGAKSLANSLLNWVSNLASSISGAFTSFLGIHSPSRVFYEHGRNTLLGYIAGLQAVAPQVRQALAAVGGSVAYGGLPGIAGAGYGASSSHATVNLTANFASGMQGYNSPQFYQYLQQQMQEAVLRYNVNNPSNGLSIPGGRL